MKGKANCLNCLEVIIVEYCCNSYDCGCFGNPIDPPFCSNECFEAFKVKAQNTIQKKEIDIPAEEEIQKQGFEDLPF